MQIERLIQMIFYIVNHEHVTARQLANYFNVSTRTIYRDINTLTIAGIPVISAKGTGGGISMIEGYTIDRSLLSAEDQQQIYQGLQMLQAAKYPKAEIALSKISAVFRNVLEPKWLEVDFTHWGSDEKEKIKLSELQYAILNKQIITFHYFNSELQRSEKTIEPLRLIFKSHAWYIAGYCRSRQEIRIFRMSRMKQIRVLPELFERELPADYSLAPECGKPCDLPVFKLRFASEIAYRVYDDFHEEQVSVSEDGSCIVTVQYQLSDWTFNYLLSFGNYIEVLEPPAARVMLRERAMEIVKKYEPNTTH